ncbi:MAG: queuosine precursor transporter [Candidatus Tectomicrobia bacterium]|nr:queuosine precursor transporter [Candidatus Tectomicrobia bacterium]
MRKPSDSRRLPSGVALGVAAMAVVVTASNILVQYQINNWLTWGALSYPFAFLVTDLTNRRLGPAGARRVVWVGFAFAVALSAWLATPRIAGASGTAFLVGQLADVWVFDRLRHLKWWQAPLVSSSLGSILDTALFFSLAFAGTGEPWVTLGAGDLAVKAVFAALLLIPFRLLLEVIRPDGQAAAEA